MTKIYKSEDERLSLEYFSFTSLLGYFMEDLYLPVEEQDDLKTIENFISIFDGKKIKQTLKEGREILAMEPFPAWWIRDTTNRRPFDGLQGNSPELYYQWTSWILDTLESEAKKAGKI